MDPAELKRKILAVREFRTRQRLERAAARKRHWATLLGVTVAQDSENSKSHIVRERSWSGWHDQ